MSWDDRPEMPKSRKLWLAAALWLATVLVGMGALAEYATTPGSRGDVPGAWPVEFATLRDSEGPTLVVFCHPKCPCSRSSVRELERLVAECDGEIAVSVQFWCPAEASDDWARTDLWRSAASIPGVSVSVDRGGVIARRFGAETSGHAMLYDRHGELVFSGGITAQRGHEGDNTGRSSMVAWVRHAEVEAARSEVFGCELYDPAVRDTGAEEGRCPPMP